mmetsp:Transcript_21228/g.21633  ORF Transcript_21228/g.21633 Transcript_21228/m.21633 type:complete len:89 (-) Transcript_21228:118-384(-)
MITTYLLTSIQRGVVVDPVVLPSRYPNMSDDQNTDRLLYGTIGCVEYSEYATPVQDRLNEVCLYLDDVGPEHTTCTYCTLTVISECRW